MRADFIDQELPYHLASTPGASQGVSNDIVGVISNRIESETCSGRFTNNYYINPAPFLPTTHFFVPSSLTPKDAPPASSEAVAEAFLNWMSPPPRTNGQIVPSPLSGTEPENGIDWDDVRVQSWNAEERHDNGAYIEKSVELNKAIKSMQVSQLSASLLHSLIFDD